MNKLKLSKVIKTVDAGNIEFSARKVSSLLFEGLMDPIIGFDHFQLTKDVTGAHPHAGISAIIYLFGDSAPYHSLDSYETDQVISPGAMMWTWAGSGVVQIEFPIPQGSRVHGLLVLLNITASKKQSSPQILYVDNRDIPEISKDGFKIRLVCGSSGEFTNPVVTPDKLTFLHIFLDQGKDFAHLLQQGWSSTIYVVKGKVEIQTSGGNRKLESGCVIALGLSIKDEIVSLHADADSEFVLLSGEPLNEQIYSSGSMSMGSVGELGKAISDFEEGKMGFINLERNKIEVQV